MVVRKTKQQTTALLNTQFSFEACAREARWVKKHSQGHFPAAESRLPDENMINAFYMFVRKTKKQTTAGLNTGFPVKLAREKLDGFAAFSC
jgi:hypothetical protein